jgi:hypothetical protein
MACSRENFTLPYFLFLRKGSILTVKNIHTSLMTYQNSVLLIKHKSHTYIRSSDPHTNISQAVNEMGAKCGHAMTHIYCVFQYNMNLHCSISLFT